MQHHPERPALLTRAEAAAAGFHLPFEGSVFRFIKPGQSSVKAMFTGKGPRYNSGRWLLKGNKLATYTSLLPETALAEALAASRYYGFPESSAAPLKPATLQVFLEKDEPADRLQQDEHNRHSATAGENQKPTHQKRDGSDALAAGAGHSAKVVCSNGRFFGA